MYELQFRLLLIFTVANRLDEQLTLLDGTKISVEPYREYQRRKSSQIVSNTCQAPPEDDSRSSSQRSIGTSNSVDASGNGIHESWSQQSSPPSMHSENRNLLSFPREKLKLMNMVWEMDSALRSSCECVVRFDKQTHAIILEGAVDDITAANMLFYEMSLASTTQRVDVTPQIKGLISTDKGENWLTEDFRKRDIAALVFIKDGAAHLIARDEDTLIAPHNLL